MGHQKSLQNKIEVLFDYRMIPEMLQISKIGQQSPFLSNLYTLQKDIYYLDEVLESHWDIDVILLDQKWSKIYLSLEGFGYNDLAIKRLVRNIEVYQRHELNMRKDKWPTYYTMKYLYYYKSCDVKLLRKLIYEEDKSLEKRIPEATWRHFDLITEVNDDVDDLLEDLETINGNRFLISVLRKGKAETKREYLDFLDWNVSRINHLRNAQGKNDTTQEIFNKALQAIDDTKSLMDERLANCSEEQLESAKIWPMLKVGKVG